MKYALLLFISLPAFAAPILPVAVESAPTQYLADCRAESSSADFTEIFLEASGTLTARTNPRFKVLDPHFASFLAFDGLAVEKTTATLSVKGDLTTIDHVVPIDFMLKRGTQSEVYVGAIKVLCDVK